jgi:biopolymer transport protein TolR
MAGGLQNMGGDENRPLSEINITPFVDVMLVLLVIFMITAPMLETGIPIELPKASGKALPREESPVTLNLSKDGRVFLNRQEVQIPNLRDEIHTFFKSRSTKEIFIRADGTLPYAFVAQAMATVKAAGINRIGLVTLPPEGSAKTSGK